MGSIGDSAELGGNLLVDWQIARAWLDQHFWQYRNDIALQMDGDSVGMSIAIQILNSKWRLAKVQLSKALLPQRPRKHFYRPIATVNYAGKVKPRNSITLRRRKGQTAKTRKDPRSHHPGHYVSQGRRGRPRTISLRPIEEQKRLLKLRRQKRLAHLRERTAKARAARGWKPYGPRRKPPLVQAARAKAQQRAAKIKAARLAAAILYATKGWTDRRRNHHPELAYVPPNPRQRATTFQAKHGKHFHRAKVNNLAVFVALSAHRIHRAATRSKHLRGYWRQVHELAGLTR